MIDIYVVWEEKKKRKKIVSLEDQSYFESHNAELRQSAATQVFQITFSSQNKALVL